jgi:oligopeptidase B
MTLIHRRDLPRDHANPAFLYGYGAYGETVEPAFRSSWLTWLTRGFVVAIAHVRGGGLLGEAWYQAGKGTRKENSFRDFLACARGLDDLGLSARGRICIHGASAGGMLIGVALNRAPDWFAAAVATVPFVDCLQTMLDPSLPLTTFEYEEWGNPADPGVRAGFEKWSPCENVRPAAYPPTLAIAALEDSRVPFHEAARWISLLRRNQRGRAPLLLHTFLDEGHAGASGRYAALRQTALEQAFILQIYHMSFDGADMKSSTV